MDLVELVKGEHTGEETVETAFSFIEKINKIPVLLKKGNFWICC